MSSSIIKLSIDTDGYYTEADKEALLENFLAFILEADPDAIEGTESLSISSGESTSTDSESKSKEEIISEFLVNAKFSVRVEKDGIGFETGVSN